MLGARPESSPTTFRGPQAAGASSENGGVAFVHPTPGAPSRARVVSPSGFLYLTSPPLIEEARSAMPTKKELPDNWPVLEHAGLLDAPAPWEDPSAWRFDRDRREYVLRQVTLAAGIVVGCSPASSFRSAFSASAVGAQRAMSRL
jgi:hypothetical protein